MKTQSRLKRGRRFGRPFLDKEKAAARHKDCPAALFIIRPAATCPAGPGVEPYCAMHAHAVPTARFRQSAMPWQHATEPVIVVPVVRVVVVAVRGTEVVVVVVPRAPTQNAVPFRSTPLSAFQTSGTALSSNKKYLRVMRIRPSRQSRPAAGRRPRLPRLRA